MIWKSTELEVVLKKKFEFEFDINDIIIDSRKIKKKSLFVPIKGPNFDGHDFILDVLKDKTVFSFIEKSYFKTKNFSNEYKKRLIVVNDSLKTLIQLAKYSRERAKEIIIICVTGSSGKTTVKNWLNDVLKRKVKTYSSFGNFNNHIGMPLSLSKMPKETKVGIFELGMNKPGEIKKLSKIIKPNISIITNVGFAHIGNFKNKEMIAREKSSIFSSSQNGTAIIPSNTDFFSILKKNAKKTSRKIYTFGKKKNSNFKIIKTSEKYNKEKLVTFKILDEEISLSSKNFGNHFDLNVLIVLGVAKILNIELKNIISDVKKLIPINGRGRINECLILGNKIKLLDDSYNSNPDSLKASLNYFGKLNKKNGRKICIIGDMLELGSFSKKMHLKMVNFIIDAQIDIVFTVGKDSEIISSNLPESIYCKHYLDINGLYEELCLNCKNNDLLMIKGSNSIKLHKICDRIRKN